ncbi:MAG TPA: hypothetical protein VK195_09780 [Burkholderiaceae bacterium]|nr:hypothetical protein [Burkholderiaceae bacterium]
MRTRTRSAPPRWRLGLAMGLVVLGLTACQPEDPRAAQAAEASPELLARLDQIELGIRMHPRQTDDELRELAAKQPPGSAARLEVLGLRAVVVARVDEAARYEELRQQLEQWPSLGDARVATTVRLTLAVIDARRAALSGQGQKLKKVLAVLDNLDETGQPARLLLTLYSMQAGLLTDQGQFDRALRAAHRVLELADGPAASPSRRVYARLSLSGTYAAAQQFEQAVKAQEEAEQLAANDKNPLLRYAIELNRSSIFTDRDRAITERASQAALDAARETGLEDVISNALANRADDFLRKKEWAGASP